MVEHQTNRINPGRNYGRGFMHGVTIALFLVGIIILIVLAITSVPIPQLP